MFSSDAFPRLFPESGRTSAFAGFTVTFQMTLGTALSARRAIIAGALSHSAKAMALEEVSPLFASASVLQIADDVAVRKIAVAVFDRPALVSSALTGAFLNGVPAGTPNEIGLAARRPRDAESVVTPTESVEEDESLRALTRFVDAGHSAEINPATLRIRVGRFARL